MPSLELEKTVTDSNIKNNEDLKHEPISSPPQEEKEKSETECENKLEEMANVDPEVTSPYQAETIDFPDSPQTLKRSKGRRSNEGRGDPLGVEGTYDEDGNDDDEDEPNTIMNDVAIKPTDLPLGNHPLCSGFNSKDTHSKRKIKVNPDILSSEAYMESEDQKSLSSISNKSDADIFSPVDDLITTEDIDTPDDFDDSVFDKLTSLSDQIPELSAMEEYEEERSWKSCVVGGIERKIDMKVIEPYKKVMSHGGYFGPSRHAIIVFNACFLPDRGRRDYDYVMDNLFLYVLATLDQLVAEDYVLVYLHGATDRSNMPAFGWLKRCYQMIDRRLRKNLKGLYLVHPTFWLKTIVIMTKPFISTKFSRKLRFVNNLQELADLIPMDQVCIPDKVKQYDEFRSSEM